MSFQLDRLDPILNQTKLQSDNPSLYQVIKALIDNLRDAIKTITGLSSSSNSSGILLFKTITIQHADILTLPTVPVLLLPAPALGFWNKLIGATISTSFSAAGYNTINAVYAAVQIQTPTGDWLADAYVNDSAVPMQDATNLLSGIDGVFPFNVPTIFPSASNGWQQYVATLITRTHVSGIATYLSIDNNGTGDLGGGDPANSMLVTLYYIIEKL